MHGCRYLNLKVGDFGTDEGISRVFFQSNAFIDSAMDSGGTCYVHCANGSNRSPTIVVAYLLHSQQCSLRAAYTAVMTRRPHIMILKDNQQQLEEFARAQPSGKDRPLSVEAGTFLLLNQRHKKAFKKYLRRFNAKKG